MPAFRADPEVAVVGVTVSIAFDHYTTRCCTKSLNFLINLGSGPAD